MFDPNISVPPLNRQMQTPEQRAQYLLEEQIQEAPQPQKQGFKLPQLPSIDWRSPNVRKVASICTLSIAVIYFIKISQGAQTKQGTLPQVQAAVQQQSQVDSQELMMLQARRIVQDLPIESSVAGQREILGVAVNMQVGDNSIKNPVIIKRAAELVIKDQRQRNLMEYAGRMQMAMEDGQDTSGHVCYQKSMSGCVSLIREGAQKTPQLNSFNAEIASDEFLEDALNLILLGQVQVANYEETLHRLAIKRQRDAIDVLMVQTDEANAERVLELLGTRNSIESQIESTQP